MADDLRLCRWSHLPLVANRFYKSFDYEKVKLTKDYYPAGWTIKKSSSLVAYHSKNIHIYISVAGGGVIRIFNNSDLIFEEKGLLLKKKDRIWNTRGYRIPRKILHNKNILSFEGDLHKARYSFPGFLSRTILRILCINYQKI